MATSRFYFFDVGVAYALMKRGEIRPGSELFGPALEHQVFLELRACLDYRRLDLSLKFWRTHTGYEVDFLLGDAVAIEVKATRRVSPADLRGLAALADELSLRRRVVVSMEPLATTDEGVQVLRSSGRTSF